MGMFIIGLPVADMKWFKSIGHVSGEIIIGVVATNDKNITEDDLITDASYV